MNSNLGEVSAIWSLHNPLKAWTLQGLSLEQAQLVVATLTTAEHSVCLAWKKDWPDWEKLKAPLCQELFKSFVPRGAAPPLIKNSLLDDADDEITQVRPVLKKRSLVDRKFNRYEVKVPCEVIVGEKVFTTSSQDISEGGVCFADPMPEWVAGYFTVIIKAPTPVELTCMMVEDQKSHKLRAEILDDNQAAITVLRTWLESSGFPIIAG